MLLYILVCAALFCDLLAPILVWKFGLPESSRLLSQLFVLLPAAMSFLRLARVRRPPFLFWLVVTLSITGTAAALANQQSPGALIWGWWLMFKYPLLGLCMYFQDRWPVGVSTVIWRLCVTILVLQLGVQFCQFFTGELPGDNLSGLFGPYGTGHLFVYVMLSLALALGHWIITARMGRLVLVLAIGTISSVLGEIKLFFFAVPLLAVTALLIKAIHDRKFRRIFTYSVVMCVCVAAFPTAYDYLVPGGGFSGYLDAASIDSYLSDVRYVNGDWDVGRNIILTYVWSRISRDPIRLVFGEGLGARSESRTLHISGTALSGGPFPGFSGTSAAVIVNELGLVGLLCLLLFMILIIRKLVHAASSGSPESDQGICYGLVLFTMFIPLWLWYGPYWISPVPMLIYWIALGYASRDSRQSFIRHAQGARTAGFRLNESRYRPVHSA